MITGTIHHSLCPICNNYTVDSDGYCQYMYCGELSYDQEEEPVMSIDMSDDILPKEITKDSDTGIEYASFDYYDGIRLAKLKGWKQTTSMREIEYINTFIVCCGDVMIRVTSNMYSSINRRII